MASVLLPFEIGSGARINLTTERTQKYRNTNLGAEFVVKVILVLKIVLPFNRLYY